MIHIHLLFSEVAMSGLQSQPSESGLQSQPLTGQGGMLHPTEPLLSHLENGTNKLTLGEPSKVNPTGRDSITSGTRVAQGGWK